MARYATLNELGDKGRALRRSDSRVLAKAMGTLTEGFTPVRGSTFLSHSSKDASDSALGVMAILKEHGASVYVDKKDPSLPPHTSHETARALKQRVKACDRFVLFATQQSSSSRWVPWELGLADGFKTPGNVAVFPGVENAENTGWTSEEYLGIYDRIVFGDLQGHQGKVWMVLNSETNRAWELSEWISRR